MDFREDDPRFDAGSDGLYAVMCHNYNTLPESEIREDFSKFGNIVSLRQIESGLCFIRYKEKYQLINCLKEMANNPKYNAKLPKSRRSFKETNKYDRNEQRVLNDEQSCQGKGNFYAKNKTAQSGDRGFKQDLDLSHHTSSRPHGAAANHDESSPIHISGDANRSLRVSSPSLHPDQRSSSPPPLMFHGSLVWEEELQKLQNVPAVEVIVANLPPGMYQSELYILCAEGQPLHIEMNTTTHPYQLNYATVFVKTLKHAQKLISELNGQFLENNILVVALADTILEETEKKQKQKRN